MSFQNQVGARLRHLREVRGLSRREPQGRWSDANLWPLVSIRLTRPVSGPLCLDLTLRAAPRQAGAHTSVLGDAATEPDHVVAGSVRCRVRLTAPGGTAIGLS